MAKKIFKAYFLKKLRKTDLCYKKSCQIKIFFVNKDLNEKSLRMILNFGHTFAHAIEVKKQLLKKHDSRRSSVSRDDFRSKTLVNKKVCNHHTVNKLNKIYIQNNLTYTFKKFNKTKTILDLLPFLKNDKKNDDEKINFILLKNIGKTTSPNKFKVSMKEMVKISKRIIQY